MRRLTWITATLIALFITGTAFASSSKEDAALFAVREAVWRSWFAGDIQTLKKLVPQNSIAINSGEEKMAKSDRDISGSHSIPRIRRKVDQPRVLPHGDTAFRQCRRSIQQFSLRN